MGEYKRGKYVVYENPDFIPKGTLLSRYAKKVVDSRFYGTLDTGDKEQNEKTLENSLELVEIMYNSLVFLSIKNKKELTAKMISLKSEIILRDFCK